MNYLTERIETLPGGGVVDGITYLFSAKIEVTSDIFPCRFDRSRGNSGMDVYTFPNNHTVEVNGVQAFTKGGWVGVSFPRGKIRFGMPGFSVSDGLLEGFLKLCNLRVNGKPVATPVKAGVYIQGNDADMARFLEANPQYAGYSPLPCSYNLYPLLLPNGEGVKTVWWEN